MRKGPKETQKAMKSDRSRKTDRESEVVQKEERLKEDVISMMIDEWAVRELGMEKL